MFTSVSTAANGLDHLPKSGVARLIGLVWIQQILNALVAPPLLG